MTSPTDPRHFHASCVRVFGRGVLILGASGSGKTDCALGLVARGHKFVADDVVIVTRRGSPLIAKAHAETRRLAHVRDVGIVDVARLFGKTRVITNSRIDLVVTLCLSGSPRVVLEPGRIKILAREMPHYKMGVSGRDAVFLIELAARRERVARVNS